MSINLSVHSQALQEARQDVINPHSSTNWALFGYEGQTNNLKVVSSGSEGISEMVEDLNSGKIMYAFLKVNDPKTSLHKLVLINWQGEGANSVRKGMCANHLRDVEKLFRGAHLTINARNEEEVEEQVIIDKVSKIGSKYCFKSTPVEIEQTKPVGTVYERINPIAEINSKERDQFWKKEEEEEKLRKQLEQNKKDAERKALESENASKNLKAYGFEEDITTDKTESKLQEAHNVISQKKISEAKSVFEQRQQKDEKKAPEKPVRVSLLKNQVIRNEIIALQEDKENQSVNEQSDDEDQFSTIKRCPKKADKHMISSNESDMSEYVSEENEIKTALVEEKTVEDEYNYEFSVQGIQAKALYDYQAADDSEITFDPGDIITNIDMVDDGWWQGLAPDGTYGLFPANYVVLLK